MHAITILSLSLSIYIKLSGCIPKAVGKLLFNALERSAWAVHISTRLSTYQTAVIMPPSGLSTPSLISQNPREWMCSV